MLILFEHMDYFKWKALSPGSKMIVDDAPLHGSALNALVVFTVVLKQDVEGNGSLISRARNNIRSHAQKVKATTIVLYPFAHLTSEELACPELALNLLKNLEGLLTSDGFDVVRTPFGWHKQREGKTAAHESSIAFRTIR